MFAKLFAVSVLAAFVSASPTPGGYPEQTPGNVNQCNVGPAQCCKQTMSAGSAMATANPGLLALLQVVVQDVNVIVGLDCSPISVIGGGNGGCNSRPVCCNDNSNGGLVSIGCVPISI
ncbi:fungal hydrophobin [Marasmius fiardii PR-910]|nr:fungal hydrophobin [Marasmius fiardii PR-910]